MATTMFPDKRPIWKSWTPWCLVLLWFAFYLVITTLPFREDEGYEIVNALVASTCIGILWGWRQGVCITLRKHPWELRSDDFLLLGVNMIALGLLLSFAGLWAYRVTNDTIWIEHSFFAVTRFVAATGLAMLLAAGGSVDYVIPASSYLRTGAFIAAGLSFLAILFALGLH